MAEIHPNFSSSKSLKILEIPALVFGVCEKAVKALKKVLKSTDLLEAVIYWTASSKDWFLFSKAKAFTKFLSSIY